MNVGRSLLQSSHYFIMIIVIKLSPFFSSNSSLSSLPVTPISEQMAPFFPHHYYDHYHLSKRIFISLTIPLPLSGRPDHLLSTSPSSPSLISLSTLTPLPIYYPVPSLPNPTPFSLPTPLSPLPSLSPPTPSISPYPLSLPLLPPPLS